MDDGQPYIPIRDGETLVALGIGGMNLTDNDIAAIKEQARTSGFMPPEAVELFIRERDAGRLSDTKE